MNVIDILILIVLAWGAFRGFTQGFILQVVTFVALILGIWASIKFSDIMADFLTRSMDITGKYLPVLSFILIFVLVIVIAHLIGMLLTRFVEIASLGWMNRIGGIAFGILKMAFIVSVFLTLQTRMKEKFRVIPEKQEQTSVLYKSVASIAPIIFPHLKLLALNTNPKTVQSEE